MLLQLWLCWLTNKTTKRIYSLYHAPEIAIIKSVMNPANNPTKIPFCRIAAAEFRMYYNIYSLYHQPTIVGLANKYMMLTQGAPLCSTLVILSTLFVITIAMTVVLPVYGHTFSQNENSLFLTRINQMHSQLQLAQSLLSTNNTSGNSNTKFIHARVMEALALLNQKDPVSNFTWNQEIAERNQRVANDLVKGLNNLAVFINQEASAKSNSKIGLANESSSIQDKINNLGGLLDEAISARVAKDMVNNSTNQALVLANMGNEIFYSYGQALGFPYAKLANMVATMKMNANNNKVPAMANKVNIVNESQYQNAKAYVKQAQEIVSKYLKSSATSTNKNSTTDIQSQLNNILSQLKTTVDSKGQFRSVMTLIHLQLHPRLIANYKIS
jgi:hypothetical protein